MMFDAPAFVAQRAVMALLWRKPTTALSKTSAETATDPFVQDRRRNRAFIIHHTPTPEHGQNLTERHHHKSRLMNSIPPANSTNQSDGNVSTPMTLIPFLAVLGSIVGLTLVVLILCGTPSRCFVVHIHTNEHSFTIRLRYHHRQSRRDVEAAKSKKREIVDLQTLNNASPSQKYEAVKGLKKQATWASTQSSSAEVW